MARPSLAPRERWIAATSILCLLVHVAPVRAQSAEAEALFADGDALMRRGRFAEACDAFEASNRIEARAGTLIRLGECREQNHQFASAWSAYKDALTRVKDPRKRSIANERVARLEPRLSYLTVSVPDESRVDGLSLTRNGAALDPALWNRAIPVNGGAYVIAGRAPGCEEWQTTVNVPIEAGKVSIEVPKFKELIKLVPPPSARPVVPPPRRATIAVAPSPTGVDAGTTGAWTTQRKVALGVAGAGAVGIVAGVVLGLQATGKQTDARTLCPDPSTPCAGADDAQKLIQDGQSRALAANVAFGVGGAAAIAAGILWFTGAQESPHRGSVTVVPSVGPGSATVSIHGGF